MTAHTDQSAAADYVMQCLHSPGTTTAVTLPDKTAARLFRALLAKRTKQKGYTVFSRYNKPTLTIWRVG